MPPRFDEARHIGRRGKAGDRRDLGRRLYIVMVAVVPLPLYTISKGAPAVRVGPDRPPCRANYADLFAVKV